ncbi:hypothetical protein [Luedemannella helvata]|uniref:Uncharacterized protein n=1 Tax=Luedemannella helvata TaxID=349315 RepID=A0ABP4WTD4_9ACTN
MEPVTLVVTALVAGATAGISGMAASAVVDAYGALKNLVLACFRRGHVPEAAGLDLIAKASDGPGPRAALEQQLTAIEIDEPTMEAAQTLLDLLEKAGIRKFHVEVHDSTGVQVGDKNSQTINIHPR